jgi:alkylation response protein AidB-like acyl-CoA dehydrogenase
MNTEDAAIASDLETRANELVDTLRERALEIEATRYLPRDIANALAKAGLLRMAIPRQYGGYETDVMTILRVVETLASADASSAWCVFIHVTSTLPITGLAPAVATTILADPLSVISGVFAPRGQAVIDGDSYVVSGRWSWGSGIRNAQWVSVGCMLMRDGAPELDRSGAPTRVSVFVPADKIQILDTWHVSGLCGTGSNDFVIENYRAPHGQVASAPIAAFAERPLYRFPRFGLLSSPIGAISLGLARAAIRELSTLASSKVPDGSRRSLANRPTTQISVARAEAAVRAARGYFYESIEAGYRAAIDGEPTTAQRLHIRLATTHAVKTSAEVVSSMYELGGGSALYTSSPLQRIFRDVHAATQHMMVSSATFELAGRLLLGLETDVTGL